MLSAVRLFVKRLVRIWNHFNDGTLISEPFPVIEWELVPYSFALEWYELPEGLIRERRSQSSDPQ